MIVTKTCKQMRAEAHEACRPQIGNLALAYFLMAVISGALGGLSYIGASMVKQDGIEMLVPNPVVSSIVSILTIIISFVFSFSLINIAKRVVANEKVDAGSLFREFNTSYIAYVVTLIVKNVFIFLWTLLLIIPGIIKSYSYALTQYIYMDEPSTDVLAIITKSREMMNGNKMKLFLLQLSYIGWFILCLLTLGILSFWVMPRYNQAMYNFYKEVKAQSVNE